MESSSIWRLPEVSKAARMSMRELPAIPTSPLRPDTPPSIARDFWIPQVSGDGQIYYANTVTGQLSRDLPFDVEDETFDCDLAGLTSSQSSSRAGTGAGLGFSYGDVNALSIVNNPSQYQSIPVEPARPPYTSLSHYPNNLAGALTAPVKPSSLSLVTDLPPGRNRAQTDSSALSLNRHTYRVPSDLSSLPNDQVLKRSFTTRENSYTSHQMFLSMDQHPRIFSYSHRPHMARKGSRLKEAAALSILPQVHELPPDEDPSHLLTVIPSLEEVLSPRPPELISELLDRSQHAIRSVITHLQQFGIPRIADDEVIVDRLISTTIASVRDLLYVSGPSFGQIPSHLVPKGSSDQQSTSTASHTLLVPAQRRAIATLSKFLLSARAILNDGPWSPGDSIGNLATDATELERSVVDFVSITQSCRCDEWDCDKAPRHLQGYFSAPHAGFGKAGAGAAGAWKGFGWVTIDGNEEAPRRSLDSAVLNDIVGLVLQVQDKSNEFVESLRASAPAGVVTSAGLRMMNQLSSLLLHIGDLHIARHVDIEPVDQAELSDGARYLRTAEKARVLVRSFEATTQAVYDDGAALLTTTQRIRHVEESETWRGRDEHYDTLEALNSSLDFNLQVLRQTLESLLVIVQEQTDILERSNKSPIEWRMSQRSLITAMLAEEALNGTNNDLYNTNDDEADDILRNIASSDNATPTAEIPGPHVINGQPPLISDTVPWADYEDLRIIRTPPRQDKIRAFFGDDAPSHYLITLNAETKPWYLRPTYNPNDVLVDPDGTTRGGTVAGLVERLTAHEYADPKFSKAFLMTYKTFTTLDELFRLLVERFWIQPPDGLNSPELVEWRKLKRQIIRIRVINTIKSMVQDDDVLERDDAYILDRMMKFVSHDEVINLPAAKQLMVIIKRAQRGRDPNKVTISTALDPPPPPIVPKRMELLDIDALELARQLTITESQLYQKIRPSECLLRSKESKTDHHDNIANFIRRSNRVANWVAYAILCKDEPRRRASIMKHFISVADRCRHIQNFSTMLAIVSGLNSSPIRRLKRSWEQVGTRYMSQLETCETTINSYKTFNIYRHALAKVSPPCLPFVGVFLTALTHIQDGSKDYLPNNLVNFRKRQKASEVIQDLQRWQTQPHNFHPLPTVLVYLDDALGQFDDKDVSDVFWQLSLEREPREKEEEKLARMLHESGFF
ncbi:ras GEF [Suillus fuscotomentosus]|uniref:Ras GEF n=1 Tax=Suillus fuscotomentosus TaxID=1912939 RepID=A0AAD4HJ90_9AGAM|nr:ras GEF [Suillus fuscotomentosus]KAG1898196.1 ras GEF [Suillus fuscotomentosus]